MNIQTLVERLKPHRERLFVASVVAFVIGVIGLLFSELWPAHLLRVPVATLISLGGIGAGIDIGLQPPGKSRFKVPALVKSWRGIIATIAALLAVAPVVIVLLIALLGIVDEAEMNRSGVALALGVLVVLAMTVLTLLLTVQSIQAIMRAAKQTPADGISAEARAGEGQAH